jgi:hypothetical protein
MSRTGNGNKYGYLAFRLELAAFGIAFALGLIILIILMPILWPVTLILKKLRRGE